MPEPIRARTADDRARQRIAPERGSVLFVSSPETPPESQAATLGFGLIAIVGLLFISTIAFAAPAWLGLLIGLIELAVAWRVTPPAGARSLRVITGLMGLVTVAWSVVRLFISVS